MRSQHGDTLDKQLHALSTLRHIGEAISRALKTQRRNYMRSQHCDTLEKQLHALSTLRHIGEAITRALKTLRHTLRQSCETKSNMLRELHRDQENV